MTLRSVLALALVGSACATATPLHKAAADGDLAEVKRLLASGAKVDAREGDEDLTPLGWAAAKGRVEVATALLDRGADPSARSNEGFTPLLNAAYFHETQMVQLLLSRKAELSATTLAGEGALHRALARFGPYRRRAGPVSAPQLEAMTATVTLLLDRGADPNVAAGSGETPLMYAALTGHRPAVAVLIERGAKVDAVMKGGHTALAFGAQSGSPEIAAMLVEKGASVTAKDAAGKTPLLLALQAFSMASPAGQKLLASSASPAVRAAVSRELAASDGKWRDVAMYLIERGADVVTHPPQTHAPLLLVAVTGDVELSRALLAHGAPIDEVTKGETALHAAIAERQAGVVALLLERGASVKVVNMSGRTPLHFAAAYVDDPALVEELVSRGADVNARDVEGRTPLHYANQQRNAHVAEALRAHGGK